MKDKHQDCEKGRLLTLLKKLEEKQIIVIVKSGHNCTDYNYCGEDSKSNKNQWAIKSCCKHKGTLCKVYKEYITLISNNDKIHIPIKSISTIIDKN